MTEDFIVEHPGVAATIIGLLFTSLLTFIVWWFKVIRSRLLDHIKREDEVLLPQINSRFDLLTEKLEQYHVDNLKKFLDLDKRLAILELTKLAILELAKRTDVIEILSRIDKLSDKMDEENG